MNKPTQLYRAYDHTGALLYVGISLNTLNRISQHRVGSSPWFPSMARLEMQAFESREEAEAAERTAIRSEQPKHNICHNYAPPRMNNRGPNEKMTGPEFRAWRQRQGWAVRQAAEALGISQSQINDYETGRKRGTDRAAPIPKHVSLACFALENLMEDP